MKKHDFNKNFSDFRSRITLTEKDKATLTDARKVIRATIRQTFNEMPDDYFTDENRIILAEFSQYIDKRIKPRFMTQGSFIYNTINKPAKPRIQQMDLDDGVYLPLSYIENKSNGNFQQMARIVRDIILNCINNLCINRKWNLDNSHSKCLRVVINNTSHIDLPIYSIPDNATDTIKDIAIFSKKDSLEKFLHYSGAENVLLSTDNGWIKSDPRVIHQWVQNNKNKFGNDFIHYSRYFKYWRDHQWDNSKFSSIMIMSGIAQALSEPNYSRNDSIALNLSAISKSLKRYLTNEGIKDPSNFTRMDEKLPNKNEIIKQLSNLEEKLNKATITGDTKLLTDCFGDRFSNSNNTDNVVSRTSFKHEVKPWLPF